MAVSADTMQILNPAKGLYAYYDGRVGGKSLVSNSPNWVDDGAYSLGVASFAVVGKDEALIYDSHISLAHARRIRTHLQGLGVAKFRLALSHWHNDHIAGNEIFADCEIIGLKLTAEIMQENRTKLESGFPPIAPVVFPNSLFEDRLDLAVGSMRVELHHFNIHTTDGVVLWLPDQGILLAGDTLEDPIPYVSEGDRIDSDIRELDRMNQWPIDRIYPNHGSLERMRDVGYDKGLIEANGQYLKWIAEDTSHQRATFLKDVLRDQLRCESVSYFEPYERVHNSNMEMIRNRADRSNSIRISTP